MTDTMPLLKTLSDIRIKSGVNEKPMLDELADAVISKVRKDTLLEIVDLAHKKAKGRYMKIGDESGEELLLEFAQELERMAGE